MGSRHFAVERLTASRIAAVPKHSSTPKDAVKCAAPKRLGFETYCYDDINSRNEFLDRLDEAGSRGKASRAGGPSVGASRRNGCDAFLKHRALQCRVQFS
jgi:hypothetical protein